MTTALGILDEDGAEALTMRRLAHALNSGTATLYRHFANRTELIAQVVDLLFSTPVENRDLAGSDWQSAYRLMARHMFAVLGRHRGVARLLIEAVPTGPFAMAQRERALAVLLANGFPPLLAARAYATLARYVLAFALQRGGDHAFDAEAQPTDAFRALNESDFPATVAVAEALPIPIDEEFSFGLELMLQGLDVLLKLEQAKGHPDARDSETSSM